VKSLAIIYLRLVTGISNLVFWCAQSVNIHIEMRDNYNEQCFNQCLKENYTLGTNLQEMIFLSQPKPSQLKQSIKFILQGSL